ncbi:MAG: GNAT family N-acetyltransferase [Candidatus Eremiobacteraeota bacterium]|nr:GNAT family N-acetyltransferase [Candidatus Eremiobacteraeota bacterium]
MSTIENVAQGSLLVRPLERTDISQMQKWQRHTDPLFTPYNVPVLTPEREETFWQYWASRPATISLGGFLGDRFIAHMLLRDYDPQAGTADLGISLDPAYLGQGLGTVLLRLMRKLARETYGIEEITLEVAGYNERAMRAYRAAGFVETGRRWMSWDTPIDFRALLAMPEHRGLGEFVRVDNGYMIVLVRMSATSRTPAENL